MKVFRTIMWALILVLAIIGVFYLFAQASGVISYDVDLKVMINAVLKVKGYVLTNITLIGAYIIKLIEIWGKKDE